MPARGVAVGGTGAAPRGRAPDRVGGGGGFGESTGPVPDRSLADEPGARPPGGTPPGHATTSRSRRPPSASSVALPRRRRRLLGGLAAFAALTLLVTAVAGGAWVGLQIFADVLLVADLAYLRRVTRRAQLARQRASAAAARARRSERARAAAGLASGSDAARVSGTPAAPPRPAPPRVRRAAEELAPATAWPDAEDEGIRLLTGTDAATAPSRYHTPSLAGDRPHAPSEVAPSPAPRRAPTATIATAASRGPAPAPRDAAAWSRARTPVPAGGGAPASMGTDLRPGPAGAAAATGREGPGNQPTPPAPAGTQPPRSAGSPSAQSAPDLPAAPHRRSRPSVVFDDPMDTAPLGHLLADSPPPPVYDLTGGSAVADQRHMSEDGVEIDVLIGRRAVND